MQETLVQFLGWENPLEKGKRYPLQYSGPENESMGLQRVRQDLVTIQIRPPIKTQTRLRAMTKGDAIFQRAYLDFCILLTSNRIVTRNQILVFQNSWDFFPGSSTDQGEQHLLYVFLTGVGLERLLLFGRLSGVRVTWSALQACSGVAGENSRSLCERKDGMLWEGHAFLCQGFSAPWNSLTNVTSGGVPSAFP